MGYDAAKLEQQTPRRPRLGESTSKRFRHAARRAERHYEASEEMGWKVSESEAMQRFEELPPHQVVSGTVTACFPHGYWMTIELPGDKRCIFRSGWLPKGSAPGLEAKQSDRIEVCIASLERRRRSKIVLELP